MNPAYHPPQPYGAPPGAGYGQLPAGQPATNQGYGPPPQRNFGGPPPPGSAPMPPQPNPQMMQSPGAPPPNQGGFPQPPANGPSQAPAMQGPPMQGPPMQGPPMPGPPMPNMNRPMPGQSAGAPGGPNSGMMSGPPVGTLTSPANAPPSGPPSGSPSGPPRGPSAGPAMGPPGGPMPGPAMGPPGGPMPGPAMGPPGGPMPGPAMGPPGGPMPGQPMGPPGGLMAGPPMSSPGAPMSGPPMGAPGGPPGGPPAPLGLQGRPGPGPPSMPPQQQFGGPPQGGNPNQLADQMSGMNIGAMPPRQQGPPSLQGPVPNMASALPPQPGDMKNGPRTMPAASFPPTLNGGATNPGAVDGPGGPPMQQDMQSGWMPNLQSPTHSRPPMQQASPYINGMPGQPQPGMNRGPVPPAGNMPNGPQMMHPGYQSGVPPMPGPGQYPPQPGMGYPQQPGMPPTHMNKGYPPAPGGMQSPSQYGPAQGGMFPAQQQPKQQKRLDPAHMPSQIQLMEEDEKNNGGIFNTCQKGRAPPLVTTNFIAQDQGYCSPRFIRASMYNVPTTVDMMKQTKIPLALVISPMAETTPQEVPPPVVDLGEVGPVRCVRCKAYMCPFMQFIDGGRRFHCLFCKATTEVPPEYFQHLDHTGMRVDRFERPELILGAYEFVATKEYCRNNNFPKPPALIFCIDVSYNNIKSGMVHLLCSQIKELLKVLPVDSGVNAQRTNMRVGFITYNNTVHFYNIKSCLAQPQMMVVGDVQEMFMPLLDGFLCDPEESASVIDALMEQIPAMFGETRETETVLAPAIQAGMEALKAADCAGKLLIFHSSLPIAEAPGKLKNRDDRKLLATDKEKTILTPQNNVYNNLGQECVAVGCSVDLFIFNNSYIDVATIGQVARLTGGEVYKYTYFQADMDGERLIADLRRNISRPIAFDSIMRVRTSTGVRATDFYGHFFMSNTTDMELASVDCDKGVAVEIKHDDKLTEDDSVYIQVALLYTSCGGQRRLRVLNLALKTSSQMADVYRTCDLDTIVNFFSKLSCYRLLEHAPKQVKDGLVNVCAHILACYRKNVASPSSVGQLILPETMKLLPLYLNCLLKNDALSGGSDMTIDDRSFVMQAVMTLDVPSSVVYFYPRLMPLLNISTESREIPFPIRCSIENMKETEVYLLENGIHMFLWIGLAASPEWLQEVFGVTSANQIDVDRPFLPELDTPLSHRVRQIVSDIRHKRRRCMRLTLVRQRDKMEMVMKHFLAEDRGVDGSPSYVDFLCQLHKEIRSLLE